MSVNHNVLVSSSRYFDGVCIEFIDDSGFSVKNLSWQDAAALIRELSNALSDELERSKKELARWVTTG